MQVIVCKDYEEMSRKAAELAAKAVKEDPNGLVSFAGGDTPSGMFSEFVKMVNSGEVDISNSKYISLDEWVGLKNTDEGSCGTFNMENLIKKLEKPFKEAHIINGAAENIEEERAAIDAFIEKYGPLNFSLLGIGMNGHIGFNEDGVDFDLNAHIIPLTETTKTVMEKYFHGKFSPTHGITQGVRQIMAAKTVVLIANGAKKADIIKKTVQGEVTNKVPASVLQNHPNCYVIVDEAAASKL